MTSNDTGSLSPWRAGVRRGSSGRRAAAGRQGPRAGLTSRANRGIGTTGPCADPRRARHESSARAGDRCLCGGALLGRYADAPSLETCPCRTGTDGAVCVCRTHRQTGGAVCAFEIPRARAWAPSLARPRTIARAWGGQGGAHAGRGPARRPGGVERARAEGTLSRRTAGARRLRQAHLPARAAVVRVRHGVHA
jgi:hypothetical protein